MLRGPDELGQPASEVGLRVGDRPARARSGELLPLGGRARWVGVDEQNASSMGETYGEVHGRRGLPDPTLQVDDCDIHIRFRHRPRFGANALPRSRDGCHRCDNTKIERGLSPVGQQRRRLPLRGVVVTGCSDGSLVSSQGRSATGVLTE